MGFARVANQNSTFLDLMACLTNCLALIDAVDVVDAAADGVSFCDSDAHIEVVEIGVGG